MPGAAVLPPIIEARAVGEGRGPLAFPVDANRASRLRAISAADKSRFEARLCRGVVGDHGFSGIGLGRCISGGETIWSSNSRNTREVRFGLVPAPSRNESLSGWFSSAAARSSRLARGLQVGGELGRHSPALREAVGPHAERLARELLQAPDHPTPLTRRRRRALKSDRVS